MPLKLKPPRTGKTPFYSVRGHYLGQYVDRSTKTGSRATAAKLLQQWKAEIERGQFRVKGEPTFLNAAARYMADTDNSRFLEPIINAIGGKYLKEITQELIDETALKLYPNGSAATRNRQVHTPISAVLKHSGKDEKMRRPKGWRGSSATEWLWAEQAFRVFKAADAIDREFGIFLRFLCYTGTRLSEATVGLPLSRLNINESFAYVAKTKNGDPRPVHLPPNLVAALAGHPRGLERPGESVFRFRKNGRLYALLNRVREKCPDVEMRGFHTFCHTWATWMRRYGGVDTRGLIATGRWRDAASARRYEHVVASEEAMRANLLPVENAWTRAEKPRKPKRRKAS